MININSRQHSKTRRMETTDSYGVIGLLLILKSGIASRGDLYCICHVRKVPVTKKINVEWVERLFRKECVLHLTSDIGARVWSPLDATEL